MFRPAGFPPAGFPSPGARPRTGGAGYAPSVRHRGWWVGAYVAIGLAAAGAAGGVARPGLLVWLLGLVVLLGRGSPNRVLRTLYDWAPLLVIVAAYDVIRANASGLIPRAHLEPMIHIDEWIGAGVVPTVRLQDALLRPADPGVLDYVGLAVYASHFVVAVVVAAFVYVRAAGRFLRYAWTFLACSLAGFATYVVYPAIPPWMASERGAIPPVVRAPDVLWEHLGIDTLARVFSGDPRYSNPVGALPSLHAAYPVLLLLLFWPVARPAVRGLLVAYAVAMGFVLVYFAEHYVADLLLGWPYAVLAFHAVGAVLARRDAPAAAPPVPTDPPRTGTLEDAARG